MMLIQSVNRKNHLELLNQLELLVVWITNDIFEANNVKFCMKIGRIRILCGVACG